MAYIASNCRYRKYVYCLNPHLSTLFGLFAIISLLTLVARLSQESSGMQGEEGREHGFGQPGYSAL